MLLKSNAPKRPHHHNTNHLGRIFCVAKRKKKMQIKTNFRFQKCNKNKISLHFVWQDTLDLGDYLYVYGLRVCASTFFLSAFSFFFFFTP